MKLRGFLTGGVLAVALTLTACGGSSGGSTGTGENAGPQTIAIGTDTGAALQFDPTTVTAPANTAVQLTFTNKSDSQPHNLAFQEGITQATNVNMTPGTSETLSFTTPAAGKYKYVCTIHPTMVGTLTVQ